MLEEQHFLWMSMTMQNQALIDFLNEHGLPEAYAMKAKKWFVPMVTKLGIEQSHAAHPLIIGINGAQGSGKTTLAALMVSLFAQQQLNAVALSLDDFYYTRAERAQLAEKVHPLLQTRGVPGTHDVTLAVEVLKMLQYQQSNVAIPRFNKTADDRYPESEWDKASAVDVVIIEGWCLGAKPQVDSDLEIPINALEQQHDATGQWRHYVNQQLLWHYPALFNLIDRWVVLKAPDFDCIYNWRLQHEKSLRTKQSTLNSSHHLMDDTELRIFVEHFQRITEHMLSEPPENIDYLFALDRDRNITGKSE